MVTLAPAGTEVVSCPFTVRVMLSGPSERIIKRKTNRRGEAMNTALKSLQIMTQKLCNILTADSQAYWLTSAITDRIEHMTPERSLVIASQVDDCESRASISELNSVTGCDLRTSIHPEVREERARGDRTGDGCQTVELCWVGLVHSYCHI